MKRYTVARARQQFAKVLDEAEEGADVVIERRGVRFVVRAVTRARAGRPTSRVEILDPIVEDGGWSWSWSEVSGLGLVDATSEGQR